MPRVLLNTALALLLVALAALTWLGRQSAPDPYLQKIQARGTFVVAMDPTYPPFDTLQSGQAAGYDAELARAIGADLQVKVEFKTLALDTLYDALAGGSVDALISALPIIPEREKEVRYSVPYYQAGQVLVVRQGDSSIPSVASLEGKKVAVELGSNADTEARRLQRTTVKSMQLQPVYHSPQDAIDALAHGQVDACLTDNASVQAYLVAHPGTVTALAPPITDEPYVVAIPADAGTLAVHINATIERLRASGDLARMMGSTLR